MAGRRSKLTPERHHAIVEAVAQGNTMIVAAGANAIGERTLQRWYRRGELAAAALAAHLADLDDDTMRLLDDVDDDHVHAELEAMVPDDERPYWRFWQDLVNARHHAEQRAVTKIREAGLGYDVVERTTRTITHTNGDVETIETEKTSHRFEWQALAWWLERTRPREYGRFMRTELTGPEGGPVEVAGVEAQKARALALVGRLEERRALEAGGDE